MTEKVRFQFLAIRVDRTVAILARPRFQFLARKVDANAAILMQPGAIEK